MNEDGRKFLNCLWFAEVALDALVGFGFRGSFLGGLSVLGFDHFLFRGGQRRHWRKRNRAYVGTLSGGSACDLRFMLRTLFRSFITLFWLRPWTYTQRPLLVRRDYRNAGMHRTYDLPLRFRVDPIRKFGHRRINAPPEGDTL
jgi:hypothetical protein